MDPILAKFSASISELKRNPSALLKEAEGSPITILNHNKPTAYLVPAETYEALLEMIDYISATYGYTREQAYLIASVAVDLRIGQLVDAPNVGVTAILPLDIFVGSD